jgi:hypothetical protein
MQSEQQQVSFFHVCKHDPEQRWIESQAALAEEEYKRYQLEQDFEREEELANEEPEAVVIEEVPFSQIMDWDLYN